MSDFYERLLEEKDQLEDRQRKLNSFMLTDKFHELPITQRSLMALQVNYMGNYGEVLRARINLINKPTIKEHRCLK